MIGTLDPTKKEVIVIGGGISGLLMAYVGVTKGYRVYLYEESSRLGGLINTDLVKSPSGETLALAESAAHSLLMSAPVKKLFEALKLDSVQVNEGSKSRYIFRDGKARKFPLTALETLVLCLRVLLVPNFSKKERTLAEWAKTHLGTAALKYLLTPFTTGIYGVAPEALSQELAFPKLNVRYGCSLFVEFIFRMLSPQKLRSSSKNKHTKVKRTMVSLKHGMGDFVRALEMYLKAHSECSITLNAPIQSLEELSVKHNVDQCNIVLSVPASQTKRLLKLELAESEMPVYTPLTSITVVANRTDFEKPPQGVGVLVSRSQTHPNPRCLGILFNSSAFQGRVFSDDKVSLTMMYAQPPTESEVTEWIKDDLKRMLSHRGGEIYYNIYRWKKAIPCYDQRLSKYLSTLNEKCNKKKGIVVFGNYTGQVSLRGMIESISSLLSA